MNDHRLWTLHAGVTQSQPPTLSTKTKVHKPKKITSLFSIHNIHYTYSYSYSDADLSLIDNILGKEPLIHLYDDDVFGRKNFFN